MRRHGRPAFGFVFATVALDMLAMGIMVPVVPLLVERLGGGGPGRAAAVTGIFAFTWAAAQFLCAPLLGALSDRWGRRPVILLSNLGLAADSMLLAWAPSLAWLCAGRIVSGLTSASVPTASAYVADVTPEAERAGRFGLLGAAFGLGFVAGPALGGWLGGLDPRLPFKVAAALSVVNFLYGWLVLPESLPEERRAPFRWRAAQPVAALRALPAGLGAWAGVGFLLAAAHESLPSVFVLYAGARYGWGAAEVGAVLAAYGAATALVSALGAGPLARRLGERGALAAGLACGAAGFAAYALAPTGALLLAGLPLLALASVAAPALQGLMSRHVGAAAQGSLQGALGGLRGVAGMVAPLVFTQVFAAATRGGLPLGAPYLLAAALLSACLLVMSRRSDDLRQVSAPGTDLRLEAGADARPVASLT